jgi:putative ABC transport system substrate-binding protein
MNPKVEMKKLSLLLVILCLVFSTVRCHASERVVVSVVFSSDIEAYQQAWSGFKEFLDEKKISLWASEYTLNQEKSEEVYSRINEEKPDVVITLGTKASKLAKERIKDTPVVFCMIFDPHKITALNITGVSVEIPTKTKLQGIKRILSHTKKIGLIYSPVLTPAYEEISLLCNSIGFELVRRKIDSEKEFPDALKDISHKIDCFLMIPDSKIYFPKSVEYLLLESLREKFPVVGLSSVYTKAGALFSFECDYNDLGRQAAKITLRILNGEKPAHIQPEMPKKINLSLNLITAKRMGIKVPSQIIKEASEVFGE